MSSVGICHDTEDFEGFKTSESGRGQVWWVWVTLCNYPYCTRSIVISTTQISNYRIWPASQYPDRFKAAAARSLLRSLT